MGLSRLLGLLFLFVHQSHRCLSVFEFMGQFQTLRALGSDFYFLDHQGVWISKHGLEVQAQPEDDQNA